MERRFVLRKEAMLAECEVASQVFCGAMDRLAKFVEPFAELLLQRICPVNPCGWESGSRRVAWRNL